MKLSVPVLSSRASMRSNRVGSELKKMKTFWPQARLQGHQHQPSATIGYVLIVDFVICLRRSLAGPCVWACINRLMVGTSHDCFNCLALRFTFEQEEHVSSPICMSLRNKVIGLHELRSKSSDPFVEVRATPRELNASSSTLSVYQQRPYCYMTSTRWYSIR